MTESLAQMEARLKALLKESRAYSDPELIALRLKLRDYFSKQLVGLAEKSTELESEMIQITERLWKLCFHRIIDDFRKQIPKETAALRKKQLTSDFRRFLNDSSQFFEALNQKLLSKAVLCNKPRARILLCLGDLARYREMVSDFEEKRWTEAHDCYLASAVEWPDSGNAQNQLAVVASYQNRHLVAAYRYQRALACKLPFDAAKGNLQQLLLKSCNMQLAATSTSAPELETFLNQTLRLQALLLLPGNSGAEQQFAMVKQALQQHKFAFRKDVAVALLLSFAFCVDPVQNQVFGAPAAASQPLAREAFCLFASHFIDQASLECTGNNTTAIGKALLYVSLVVDFCTAHGSLFLDDATKSKLDALDMALGKAGLSSTTATELENVFDEDMTEYVGFSPLKLAQRGHGTVAATEDQAVALRAHKIGLFVRQMLELDLKPLALNGEVFSVKNDDDEDEEIVFRPSFKYQSSAPAPAAPPVVVSYSQSMAGVPMMSFPPIHPASSPSQEWVGGFQPTQAAAPAYQTSSRWAFAAPPHQQQQAPNPSVRPPPGF